MLCDRMHSFKKRYFRLDVVMGKVLLHNCKYFDYEDKLALKLKEDFKQYETRASLALIPFYMERLQFIESEQAAKTNDVNCTQDELDFLQKTREEVTLALEKEKKELNEMANQIYQIWLEIEKERAKKDFSSTNVNLKVHKFKLEDGSEELTFNLAFE